MEFLLKISKIYSHDLSSLFVSLHERNPIFSLVAVPALYIEKKLLNEGNGKTFFHPDRHDYFEFIRAVLTLLDVCISLQIHIYLKMKNVYGNFEIFFKN